jgi:hypothetical protein
MNFDKDLHEKRIAIDIEGEAEETVALMEVVRKKLAEKGWSER